MGVLIKHNIFGYQCKSVDKEFCENTKILLYGMFVINCVVILFWIITIYGKISIYVYSKILGVYVCAISCFCCFFTIFSAHYLSTYDFKILDGEWGGMSMMLIINLFILWVHMISFCCVVIFLGDRRVNNLTEHLLGGNADNIV